MSAEAVIDSVAAASNPVWRSDNCPRLSVGSQSGHDFRDRFDDSRRILSSDIVTIVFNDDQLAATGESCKRGLHLIDPHLMKVPQSALRKSGRRQASVVSRCHAGCLETSD